MEGEPTSFEARAILEPRRPRLARLALLLPVVALAAVAWAGMTGAPRDDRIADIPDTTAVAASPYPPPVHPDEVIGLAVHRLADVQPRTLGRDDVIAITGWYVATAITDCPALAAIYRLGSLPYVRGDADELAFCVRLGVLYPSRPDPDDGRSENRRLAAVPVTIVVGVIMPPQLEMVGADPTEVVIVGRFAGSGAELVVDHVAWTPGIEAG
jgi:hypothetical protein